MNYIQYAGNFECYSFDAFSTRGGNRMWRNIGSGCANPLQHARVVAMRKVYENKNDNDLWREGLKIVDQALVDKHHVYAALPYGMMVGFKSRFPAREYEVTTLERWHDPASMSDEAKKALSTLGPATQRAIQPGPAAIVGVGRDHKEARGASAARPPVRTPTRAPTASAPRQRQRACHRATKHPTRGSATDDASEGEFRDQISLTIREINRR